MGVGDAPWVSAGDNKPNAHNTAPTVTHTSAPGAQRTSEKVCRLCLMVSQWRSGIYLV